MFVVQWEVKIYQFGLIFVHETTICQQLYTLGGEEVRRIERIMSSCLTWFPIGGLGEPNI